MTKPKTFEVTAKEDVTGDGYIVKAGPGCVWLAVAWGAAALIGAVAFAIKVICAVLQ